MAGTLVCCVRWTLWILLFLPACLWTVLETISVELWHLYAPAKRNPNRAASGGMIFAMRSTRRRRLSIPSAEHNALERSTSHTAVVTGQKKTRGFFDLPYELRESIWLDLLCPRGGVFISNHPRVRKITWTSRQLEAGQNLPRYGLSNILKLNRDFYCEGIALLYTHNHFAFDSPNVLTTFVNTTLPQRLALIKHVSLNVYAETIRYSLTRYSSSFMESDWITACECLRRFTGLEFLLVNIRIASYNSLWSGARARWNGFGKSKWPEKILSHLEPLEPSERFVVRYSWPRSECSQWPKGKFHMEHEPGYG